jgi:L-proline amide hydrolase
LLCLHGGPGAPHDYLEPLEAMAATGRRVIFTISWGAATPITRTIRRCGRLAYLSRSLARSGKRWASIGCIMLGNSWGGMLAQEYALIQPSGLASLVLHSSLASVPQWVSEANRLRSELPAKVRETLLKHEVDGTTDEPAYEEAMMVFYRRHVCRADPWPECVTRAFGKLTEDPEVYHVMNGPSEFHVVGVIKDWDITDRLGEISVPTLITSGCYDETTPAIAETLQRAIAGSEWVVFEQSAHLAHAEEPQRYMAVLDAFLSRVEKTGSQVSPSRKPWFL